MPRGTDGKQDANNAVSMRDEFRSCTYRIGIEAMRINRMMQSPLWRTGVKRLPRPAFDDLRAARQQLTEACTAVETILVAAADREEKEEVT